MEREEGSLNPKSLVWGIFLIALGGAFLLERMGVLDLPNLGTLWPAVFWVIAISHALDRRPGSALFFVFMGSWFFACQFEWMNLTYRNSWSLMLVALGLSIVVGALSGEETRRRRKGAAS